jgi:hypothetical protein
MFNDKLINQIERLKIGLENSSSSAEDAMIRALPNVIAALSRADDMLEAMASISKLETDPSMNDATRIAMMGMTARLHIHVASKAEAV